MKGIRDMTIWTVDSAAAELHGRQISCQAGGRLTDEWPELDVALAYQVQASLLQRIIDTGDAVVGVKLGLTSPAKQQRMGIATPLTAWLTAKMTLDAGEPLALSGLIQPRVEPEIVFVMAERLTGPGVTAEQALSVVGSVHAGLEVIDSRFADFSFALPDVIADNASSSRFAVSDVAVSPRDIDLVREACRLTVDGTTVATGTGADVQGHPAEALALAANALGERGLALEPGWVVLTGGITDAVPLAARQMVGADFTTLGSLTLAGGSPAETGEVSL